MRKVVFLATAVTLSMTAVNWSGMISSNDFDVVSDAVQGIKKALVQDKPYFVKRIYNFSDRNNEIAIKTKSYYSEYRKKALLDNEKVNATTSKNAGDIIEFVYKSSNKNQITKINKKTKQRQKIDFHMDKTELEPTGSQVFFNLIKI
jgi:hypothetical protein